MRSIALVAGDRDIEAGTIGVKDLATGEQVDVAADAVVAEVLSRLRVALSLPLPRRHDVTTDGKTLSATIDSTCGACLAMLASDSWMMRYSARLCNRHSGNAAIVATFALPRPRGLLGRRFWWPARLHPNAIDVVVSGEACSRITSVDTAHVDDIDDAIDETGFERLTGDQ